MIQFQKIGKIKDAFGIKGDLYILVFSGDISWIKKLKYFSTQSGSFSVGEKSASSVSKSEIGIQKINMQTGAYSGIYEVQSARTHKEGLVLHCVGVDDRNQAEALKGKDFCIDQNIFVSQKGEGIYLSEIQGFQVYEVLSENETQLIGEIEAFSTNGVQDLLVINRVNKKKCEVPFVEDFISDIQFDEKKIYLRLPPGLLDIND